MFGSFLYALDFLTILPLLGVLKEDMDLEKLGKSTVFFPLVGAILGVVLLAVNGLASKVWGSLVVNSIVMVTLIVLTGGIHLDGFMDSCDGLFSGKSRDRMLVIMRDSRVGAMGVICVFCLLFLKLAFLYSIPVNLKAQALILMPVLARFAMVYAICGYPYVRDEGLGLAFSKYSTWKQLIVACCFTGGLVACLSGFYGLVVWVLVWLISWCLIKWLVKRLGGLTGDSYGAINEVMEVIVLLLVSLLGKLGVGVLVG